MTQPLLHHRQHVLVAPAFGIEQPVGSEAGAGQAGREQVAAGERPQHDARAAGGDRREEEGGGGLVARAGTLARRFAERGDGQAAAGEAGVERLDAEGKAGMAPRPGGFERPHLLAQGGQAFGTGRA